MDQALTALVESARNRKSFTSKLDKLYPMFHDFSINKGFELCSNCEKAIGHEVPETLWQMLMEKEFLKHLSTELCQSVSESSSSSSASCDPHRTLSMIESNAVRYTAGFIIRKLEQKFSKKKTKEAVQCTAALRDMAEKAKIRKLATEQQPSSKWIKLVDRGGLYHVQDIVYDLFVTIEYFVDNRLSEILRQKGKGIECVRKNQLAWVVDEEEVQSLWNQVDSSSIVEDETARQNLLLEIVHLWVTTRGYSKTHKLKEEYKIKQKQVVKGKRSLRKEIASQ